MSLFAACHARDDRVMPTLVEQALQYAMEIGSTPRTVAPPGDSGERFRSDLAAGASWAASAAKLTIDAEFHFHDAGFGHAGVTPTLVRYF